MIDAGPVRTSVRHQIIGETPADELIAGGHGSSTNFDLKISAGERGRTRAKIARWAIKRACAIITKPPLYNYVLSAIETLLGKNSRGKIEKLREDSR